MQAILKEPTAHAFRKRRNDQVVDLESLITAMGKRLQAEYVEGLFRICAPTSPNCGRHSSRWTARNLSTRFSVYEQLFFEGLQRYVAFLSGERKAA